jgi:hypothetical protein
MDSVQHDDPVTNQPLSQTFTESMWTWFDSSHIFLRAKEFTYAEQSNVLITNTGVPIKLNSYYHQTFIMVHEGKISEFVLVFT